MSSGTCSSHFSLRKQVSLYRIFPVITTGAATPSKSYTPLTADSIFLFVSGPSATACNGFMKPTESLSSVLFHGTPTIFVSLGLVPTSSLA